MTINASRLEFLKNLRKKCSVEYYRESLKEVSPDDLKTVSKETAAVLQYMEMWHLPFEVFPDLVEQRLIKIWKESGGR